MIHSQIPYPDRSPFKCVILAAGSSTRLRPLTDSEPKCLLQLGEMTLLERTIRNVTKAGVDDIAIVIGYQAEKIRTFIRQCCHRQRIRFIVNPKYASTNNAYSLLLARKFLENQEGKVCHGLLLLDSDILFSPDIIPFLVNNNAQDKIAIRVAGTHDNEEIQVVIDKEYAIRMIGKETSTGKTYGESIGIELFSADTTARLFHILEYRIRGGIGRNEFYEAAFQELIMEGVKLTAVDISEFPVMEIDTLEDLKMAEQMLNRLSL